MRCRPWWTRTPPWPTSPNATTRTTMTTVTGTVLNTGTITIKDRTPLTVTTPMLWPNGRRKTSPGGTTSTITGRRRGRVGRLRGPRRALRTGQPLVRQGPGAPPAAVDLSEREVERDGTEPAPVRAAPAAARGPRVGDRGARRHARRGHPRRPGRSRDLAVRAAG